MRLSWLVTAGVCAWLVSCGGSSHKKVLTCDASQCGPDEAGAAGMAEEVGGGPSAGGKDAGSVDHEPDAAIDAGAGGTPSEAGAAGASNESELRLVIEGNGTVAVTDAAACLSSPCSYSANVGEAFALQAKAFADSRFVGWSGDCSGNGPNTSVKISGVTECTATFVVQRAVAAAVTGDGGGHVVSDPDLNCGANGCSGAVDNDTAVTLTATPDAGYGFVEWTGSAACDGKNERRISVKVTADLSCNASFAKQFKVSVSAAGADAQVGVQSGSCDALTCPVNALASASFHAAKEPAGFRFTGWSGDSACTGSATPLLVTSVTSDITCVATYTARLTASGLVGSGLSGTVTATSIDVNAVCKDNTCTLDAGTSAKLVAPNLPGYILSGWSGAGCPATTQSGSGITVTPATGNITCTANYTTSTLFSVTGTVVGAPGAVTATSTGVTCTPGNCNVTPGSSVTLTALAQSGYRFTGWSGDAGCSGTALQLTLANVTASKTCVANYLQQFTIASVAGTGGAVSAKTGTTACAGNSCTVDVGNAVTLEASPDTANGYHFTGWSGANCTATDNPLTLKNVNTTCSAAFALDQFTIAAVPGTNGSVTATRTDTSAACAGASCTVNYGVNVSLAAVANTNYHFSGWSGTGCAPTGSNPLGLKNSNATCNAAFAINTFAASVSVPQAGAGTASIACPSSNCGAVPYNQTVNVSAAANSGWAFAGWSSNCGGGAASPKSLAITGNTVCVASFRPYATAATSPSGSGQITATGSAATCTSGDPASCSVDPSGTGGSVKFVVKPSAANFIFSGWSGDCTGTNPSVTLNGIQTPKACTANFYNLWAEASGIKGVDLMTHVTALSDGTVIGLGETMPSKLQLMSLLTLDAATGKLGKNLSFTDGDGKQNLVPLGLTTDAAQKTPLALALHSGVNQAYVYTEPWDAEYSYGAGSAALDGGGELINTADRGYAFAIAVQDAPSAAGLPAIPGAHLTKLDSSGNVQWDVQFCAQTTAKACSKTQPVALAQDPETKTYAVLSQVPISPTIVALTFISEKGELLGSAFYAERTDLVATRLVRSAKADTYLVVGSRIDENGSGTAFYAELGIAGGTPRFAFSLGATTNNAKLTSVAKSAAGYALAGHFYTDAKQPTDAWLVLIDRDGKVSKQLAYGGPAAELTKGISSVPTGGFVFGGSTTTWGQGNSDMWTVRVDADGALTFDSALVPKPVFQSVNLAQAAVTTIMNPTLDTGNAKSSASRVKANVSVKSDTTFGQIKQTP